MATTGTADSSMTCRKAASVMCVDEDAALVHGRDQALTEWRQSAPALVLVIGGVGDVVRLGMRQRDVADAAFAEEIQILQVAFQGPAVLHAQRHGHQTVGLGVQHVGGAGGECEFLRIVLGEVAHAIDQIIGEGAAFAGLVDFCGDVDGHEQRVQPAGLGTGIVEVAALGGTAHVLVVVAIEAIRHVDVGVDGQNLPGELPAAFIDVGVGAPGRLRAASEKAAGKQDGNDLHLRRCSGGGRGVARHLHMRPEYRQGAAASAAQCLGQLQQQPAGIVEGRRR